MILNNYEHTYTRKKILRIKIIMQPTRLTKLLRYG